MMVMDDVCRAGIYMIVNIISQKVYVGSTTQSFKKRWCIHKSKLRHNKHRNPHLQRSWNKYGEEAFQWVVLEIVSDVNELVEREQYWFDEHALICDLYNVGLVAAAPFYGCKHTQEARRKISIANLNRTSWAKGWHHTPETKEKLRQQHLGSQHTQAAKDKMSCSHKGAKRSEAHKRNISQALMGIKRSKEHCRKNGDVHARKYPAFRHRETGEIIPPGRNLSALARERGLHSGAMGGVANGKRAHHKGWVLA